MNTKVMIIDSYTMTTKEERGREIYASLSPGFNLFPFVKWGSDGIPVIDFERLADAFEC